MANFTAADVKRLRELTGAGMMDCKKALEEADGDFEKAVEILRIKGAKDVGKRAERTTAEGMVADQRERADRAQLRDRFRRQERRASRRWPTQIAEAAAGSDGTVEAVLAAPARWTGTVADAITECPAGSARSWCSTGSPSSTARPPSTCTGVPPTCRRPSACWSQYTGDGDDAARPPAAPPCRSPR